MSKGIREHKDLTIEKLTLKEDNNSRSFTGYAAVFGNKDSYNDIIVRGAFAESLVKRKPKLAYQHDVTKIPGIIKSAQEDNYGLFVEGQLIDTQLGNEVYQLLKAGAVDKMSIGYTVDKWSIDDDTRMLEKIELYEVSFVTFPANDLAAVNSVKAESIATIRDFEKALRDVLGFTKEAAKRIASHGFRTSDEIQRDAEKVEVINLVKNLSQTLRS